jgi:hypothetical protein
VARVSSPEGITLGAGLIALGALWTLSNLGRIDLLDALHTWWPLVLVFWGLIELAAVVQRRRRRDVPSGGSGDQRWDAVSRELDDVAQLTDALAEKGTGAEPQRD